MIKTDLAGGSCKLTASEGMDLAVYDANDHELARTKEVLIVGGVSLNTWVEVAETSYNPQTNYDYPDG